MHDQLIHLRDTLFAHNQPTPDHAVLVFPPGSWTREGRASEEQTALSFNAIAMVESLCHFQLDRITPRVQELVAEICEGLTYDEGAIIYLSDIPDR